MSTFFRYLFLLAIVLYFSADSVSAGVPSFPSDTVRVLTHSPKVAYIASAIVPGLGQIYNNKVWKVPILYGGFGTAFYFLHRNSLYYYRFKALYNGPELDEYYVYQYRMPSKREVKQGMQLYRRWRDYSVLTIAGVYLLNVLDAYIDAHMFTYDVSDELSYKITPSLITPDITTAGFGLSLQVRF